MMTSIGYLIAVCFLINQARSSTGLAIGCNKPAEIYFVLDASASIWGPDFQKQLTFVKTVIAELQLDPSIVRCGLLTYGDIVRVEFDLNTYAGRKDTMAAVSLVPQLRGLATRTDKALERMRELMMKDAREAVPRIAIVMTDGQSDYPKLTKREAELTHKSGITTFAIGIGREVTQAELKAIASSEEYLFNVENFDALAAIRSVISGKACEVKFIPPPLDIQNTAGCQWSKATDVMFVLDSSFSISASDFAWQLHFVRGLASLFVTSQDGIRVGVVTYANTPKQQIHLDEYPSADDLLTAISNIVQQRGGTNTAAALRFVRQNSFPGVVNRDKVVILITDGLSDNPRETAQQAELLHADKIEVFAIGVGQTVDKKELQAMASRQPDQHVFTVDSYENLNSIKMLLARKTCGLVDSAALDKDKVVVWEDVRSKSTTPEMTTRLTTTTPKTTTTETTTTTTTPTTTTTTTTTTPTPTPFYGCGESKPADIVFALSPYANSHQTVEALEFISTVADRLRISANGVHVGLVPRNCFSVPGFTLDQGSDKNQVLRMFSSNHKTSMSDTVSTMKYMRSVSFQQQSGARRHTKKIAVMFVDRPLKSFPQVLEESFLAKTEDIELVTIGIGNEVAVQELNLVASSDRHDAVMTATSYSHLRKLAKRLVELANQSCSGN